MDLEQDRQRGRSQADHGLRREARFLAASLAQAPAKRHFQIINISELFFFETLNADGSLHLKDSRLDISLFSFYARKKSKMLGFEETALIYLYLTNIPTSDDTFTVLFPVRKGRQRLHYCFAPGGSHT